MSSGYLGYITAFDSFTVSNSTVLKPIISQSPIGHPGEAIDRFHVLANGTVVDYDGTASSDVMPGIIEQTVMATDGAIAYYNSAVAKIGEEGTLTKTLFSPGTGTETADARCFAVVPNLGSLPGKGIIYVTWRWQLKELFS